ncbi:MULTISPECIES: NAD-dependent epimerase/dehydratase family protein [Lysobacteraceae]|uniref:NAD-dependent epimerase/dehydratase family protein n=1 Tax=Coralloluteibacterium thermophilum TaxID=2707049 RepID=A0ABV9NM59_9GAMM|nr:NAD-dependent epimerase/dehydratase family protein [Luteimonas huabeiensis]
MNILLTGAAGFIGFHSARRLLANGHRVLGIDNLNTYYEVALKHHRLAQLEGQPGLTFQRIDLADREAMAALFDAHRFDAILHLGAQAGVRYSLDAPFTYIDSNLTGFLTVLEGARRHGVRHLVYASSSSVYGANVKQPFCLEDRTDTPVSLYAATKKANELIGHAYAHLYRIPMTGLRLFTVYGPWGRPDMAYFKFTNAILRGEAIDLYNGGDMERDFTFVDDVVDGVVRLLESEPVFAEGGAPHRVYNFGNDRPERLDAMVSHLERLLGRSAKRILLPMQPGDVLSTRADISLAARDLGYAPRTSLAEGLERFVAWHRDYYGHRTGAAA